MVYCGWLRKPEFQRIVFMPDEFSVVQFELFLNFSFTVRLENLKLVKPKLAFRKTLCKASLKKQLLKLIGRSAL